MAVTQNALGFPLLTIILFLPAAGAVGLSLLSDDRQARWVASAVVVLDLVLSLALVVAFKTSPTGPNNWTFQFADRTDWISSLGITYWLGVDGVAVFLIPLTSLLVAIAVFASHFMIADRNRAFLVLMLFLETSVLGVFMSINLFLFFVFWEAMLIPSYFLLGIWGEERRVYATMKFVIYTMAGSLLMLAAIVVYGLQQGTFDLTKMGPSSSTWLFLGFVGQGLGQRFLEHEEALGDEERVAHPRRELEAGDARAGHLHAYRTHLPAVPDRGLAHLDTLDDPRVLEPRQISTGVELGDPLALDVGPFVAALEYASGQQSYVVGKPARGFFEQVLSGLHVSASRAVLVGDEIESDIGGARSAGMWAILVRTGKD